MDEQQKIFQQWAKKQDLNIIILKHYRKNSYFGIKAGNVPYNKEIEFQIEIEIEGEKEKILPAQISDQMDKMVSKTPSTADSQEMVVWPGSCHLLHQRK